jgi:hypothetical protein
MTNKTIYKTKHNRQVVPGRHLPGSIPRKDYDLRGMNEERINAAILNGTVSSYKKKQWKPPIKKE